MINILQISEILELLKNINSIFNLKKTIKLSNYKKNYSIKIIFNKELLYSFFLYFIK